MAADKNIVVSYNRGRGLIDRGHCSFGNASISAIRSPLQTSGSINIDEQLEAVFPANSMQMSATDVHRMLIACNAAALKLLVKFVDEAHHAIGPHGGCLANQ